MIAVGPAITLHPTDWLSVGAWALLGNAALKGNAELKPPPDYPREIGSGLIPAKGTLEGGPGVGIAFSDSVVVLDELSLVGRGARSMRRQFRRERASAAARWFGAPLIGHYGLCMFNMRNHIHVCIGLGCVAVACSETKRAPTSTDTVSAPASEQSGEPTSTPPAPALAASEAPPASGAPPVDVCAGVDCSDGYCDVRTVECIRAPCPPVATCVAGTHPCAVTTCVTNTRCESHDGKAVCIPLSSDGAGVACGPNTCAAGQVCCNESCGICTAPDGACTQQACEPAK